MESKVFENLRNHGGGIVLSIHNLATVSKFSDKTYNI